MHSKDTFVRNRKRNRRRPVKNKREYQDFIQKNALHMKEKKDDDKLLLE